eukprot:TRINITY_DN4019_c0_g1_i1.p1 TRINITY_DN4019_c0_g1~~TRINITY_DN4019_c0_g1_i1.p1  ORF type:complete len:143 (-),score=47.27 TRINITY_DN4019_c0_g1_i1:179-553(-)
MEPNIRRIIFLILAVLQLVAFIIAAAGAGSLDNSKDFRVVWWGLVLSLLTALLSAVVVTVFENAFLYRVVSSLVIVAAGIMTLIADGFEQLSKTPKSRAASAGCVMTCIVQYGLLVIYAIADKE